MCVKKKSRGEFLTEFHGRPLWGLKNFITGEICIYEMYTQKKYF